MADNNQETFISKAKAWSCKFYNAHYFWLNAILICIGIYTIVTSAFEYFNEPSSSTDPERLGQFGDFLGGTLNPIFGFLTVCLLLWSIFIQRKELSLTRKELKNSADALSNQFKLATDEYNRKQLDESLKNLFSILNSLSEHHLDKPEDYVHSHPSYPASTQSSSFTSLKDVSVSSKEYKEGAITHIEKTRNKIDRSQNINLFNIKTLPQLLAAIESIFDNIAELSCELMQLTKISSLKYSRWIEFEKEITRFHHISAISSEKSEELLTKVKKHL